MRIAVIGRGTAGLMAAVHLSKTHPTWDLSLIYNPNIPSIGVGEGTLPSFRVWLSRFGGGHSEETLKQRCGVTRKYGIRFEGWGDQGAEFTHNFYPKNKRFAYHISADDLGDLLDGEIRATRIHKHVKTIQSGPFGASVLYSDGEKSRFDFVFDARGFPKTKSTDIVGLDCLTTDSALVRSSTTLSNQLFTRSVARPHGWVFVIPLQKRTSYGYVYNARVSSLEAVQADLSRLMAQENASCSGEERLLSFPNFAHKKTFDGSLWKLGNACSFLEPLEATAIFLQTSSLTQALRFPLDRWKARLLQRPFANPIQNDQLQVQIDQLNRWLFRDSLKCAAFVSWHYAHGSKFNTPFWNAAQLAFQNGRKRFPDTEIWDEMVAYLNAAKGFPHLEAFIAAHGAPKSTATSPLVHDEKGFGQWQLPSFIEIQRGLSG
jgi:tryptophan halogenase